ncbi:MAG: hypothetical protein GY906_13705 [bacterium]|nr:hypothetical protein [bacterium]
MKRNATNDDPNVPASAFVGLVGAIVLFVIIVALQGLFYSMERTEFERKATDGPFEDLARLDADQLETLNSYGWVDQQQGTVHVPISRAMGLVVAESQTE